MRDELEGKYVCPGDSLRAIPASGQIRVGAGISVKDGYLVTSRSGVVRQTKSGKLWIDGRQKRYHPNVGDSVIGLILERFSEGWRVDISGPFHALLPALAFEAVTRRNRPNLNPGDLVYARVTGALRDSEPTLACTDAAGKAAGFGQLKGGYLEACTTSLARRLLAAPTAPVLQALGEHLRYEAAVGLNGRLWVRAPDAAAAILVANAALASEYLDAVQCRVVVRRLVTAAFGQCVE